jgi:ParB family chromosome partitioning protein
MDLVDMSIDSIIWDAPLRSEIDDEQINRLAESIRQVGLLHPILVKPEGDQYRLLAGFRRLKAVCVSGEKSIKAIILSADASERQIGLIENLQRQDLNPVEKAYAIRDFMKENKLNKSKAANLLGIPRTTLTDWLDIMELPQRYQDEIIDNFRGGDSPLTLSHVCEAKALARVLNSPNLDQILLDAVLFYKLSKAETRVVAKLVKTNADVSVESAVKAIRHDYYISDHKDMAEDPTLLPHEHNLEILLSNLRKATGYLERLNHISRRFISQEKVKALKDNYSEIMYLAQNALSRLNDGKDRNTVGSKETSLINEE